MKWRNEQIYHLRQKAALTVQQQDNYFDNVISKLFDQEQPNQVLFSYIENSVCIGYGGLVHINWFDRNAEISFIMNTTLEENYFEKHWKQYLSLIEKVAFIEMKFHKIFIYAFDLRSSLYQALQVANYYFEAKLKEHCFYDGKYIDVIYYSKIN